MYITESNYSLYYKFHVKLEIILEFLLRIYDKLQEYLLLKNSYQPIIPILSAV